MTTDDTLYLIIIAFSLLTMAMNAYDSYRKSRGGSDA